FSEVREPALAEQVVAYRKTLEPSVDDLFSFAVELQLSILDLVQRPDSRIHGQFPQLKSLVRIEVPPLRAGIQTVNEGGTAHRKRATHAVHRLKRVRSRNGADVLAGGVARRHQWSHVLFPAMVHDPLHLPRSAERGVHAVRRSA